MRKPFRRRLISSLFIVILLLSQSDVPKAYAAIGFDAATSADGGTDDFTFDHTTGTGDDRVLIVCVHSYDATSATDLVINGVTYDGVAMTSYDFVQVGSISSFRRTSVFYLANPASGTKTVSVDVAGAVNDVGAGAISFTGVDQTTPIEADNEATGDAKTSSIVVTTVSDNAWVVDCISQENTPPDAVGADQTSRYSDDLGSVGQAASTEGPKTPAGNVTMSWTLDGTFDRQFAHYGVALKPSTPPPPPPPPPPAAADGSYSFML